MTALPSFPGPVALSLKSCRHYPICCLRTLRSVLLRTPVQSTCLIQLLPLRMGRASPRLRQYSTGWGWLPNGASSRSSHARRQDWKSRSWDRPSPPRRWTQSGRRLRMLVRKNARFCARSNYIWLQCPCWGRCKAHRRGKLACTTCTLCTSHHRNRQSHRTL